MIKNTLLSVLLSIGINLLFYLIDNMPKDNGGNWIMFSFLSICFTYLTLILYLYTRQYRRNINRAPVSKFSIIHGVKIYPYRSVVVHYYDWRFDISDQGKTASSEGSLIAAESQQIAQFILHSRNRILAQN